MQDDDKNYYIFGKGTKDEQVQKMSPVTIDALGGANSGWRKMTRTEVTQHLTQNGKKVEPNEIAQSAEIAPDQESNVMRRVPLDAENTAPKRSIPGTDVEAEPEANDSRRERPVTDDEVRIDAKSGTVPVSPNGMQTGTAIESMGTVYGDGTGQQLPPASDTVKTAPGVDWEAKFKTMAGLLGMSTSELVDNIDAKLADEEKQDAEREDAEAAKKAKQEADKQNSDEADAKQVKEANGNATTTEVPNQNRTAEELAEMNKDAIQKSDAETDKVVNGGDDSATATGATSVPGDVKPQVTTPEAQVATTPRQRKASGVSEITDPKGNKTA